MTKRELLERIKNNVERNKRIKKLIKEKNYEQLLIDYGSKTYCNKAPLIYLMKELRKLKKEKRYDQIYKKYGQKKYNQYIDKVIKEDVFSETGDIRLAKKYQSNYRIKKLASNAVNLTKASIISVAIFISTLPIISEIPYNLIKFDNYNNHKEQIAKFDEYAIEYTDELNSIIEKNNYSDLDIFMLVMNDMWNIIDGYGKPTIDEIGYHRLDILNGVGVCRNMADYTAYILNMINPEYNARSLMVNIINDGGLQLNDIGFKYAETKEDTEEQVIEEQPIENSNLSADHAVVVVEVENQILILDPTNPSISVLKDGEIYMLNPYQGNIGYEEVYFANSLLTGIDEYRYEYNKLLSYFNPYSLESIKEMYGLEAQNNSLKKVRK